MTLRAAAVENSDLAKGLWECGEVAAHNPQTGPRQEVEVRSRKAAAGEKNSDLPAGFLECGEVAAHNPQTGPPQEVAARSRKAEVRSQEAAARSPEARPPLASTYGHADQDSTPAGMRVAQRLQEALQVHLEHNSHKAHDESQRRSLQPPESHQIWQIPVRPIQPGQRA